MAHFFRLGEEFETPWYRINTFFLDNEYSGKATIEFSSPSSHDHIELAYHHASTDSKVFFLRMSDKGKISEIYALAIELGCSPWTEGKTISTYTTETGNHYTFGLSITGLNKASQLALFEKLSTTVSPQIPPHALVRACADIDEKIAPANNACVPWDNPVTSTGGCSVGFKTQVSEIQAELEEELFTGAIPTTETETESAAEPDHEGPGSCCTVM